MADQGAIAFGLSCIERLLQGIEHEVGPHRSAHPPAHDAPGKDVDHEGHIQPALPGGSVCEIADPQFVRALRAELPVDQVQRARRLGIADRGSHDFAAHHASQSKTSHQALNGAAGHRRAFAGQLPPDLVSAVDLHIALPDSIDLGHQCFVAFGAIAPVLRGARKCRMSSIARRGDLQDLADRLNPEIA